MKWADHPAMAWVTGKDPLSLGESETVGEDMGFTKPQVHALQQIARSSTR